MKSKSDVTEPLAAATGSVKYVPFTVLCPEIKLGQGVKPCEMQVLVREEGGHKILLPESLDAIEWRKAQMMLSRLVECVRELYAVTGVLPSPEPKATEQATASGCTNSPNALDQRPAP